MKPPRLVARATVALLTVIIMEAEVAVADTTIAVVEVDTTIAIVEVEVDTMIAVVEVEVDTIAAVVAEAADPSVAAAPPTGQLLDLLQPRTLVGTIWTLVVEAVAVAGMTIVAPGAGVAILNMVASTSAAFMVI